MIETTLSNKDIYLKNVLDQMPRLLGLINRNIGSKTYGCFDRQYWHYNTTDFPCAEYQESVLTLSYLYLINNNQNPYYRNSSILEWIDAGIRFWNKIQHKNGAFSEWYPYENSMSVTPFSTYAISETLLILKDKIIGYKDTLFHLEKAGNWLMRNKDMRATNHYAGSSVALFNLYLLTNNLIYKDAAEQIIIKLTEYQREEGWFMEYNGADIGYTSVAIYYLSNYFIKSRDEKVLPIISKAINFIYHFVHPDGTFGGEYGSRNTEYLIPDGFEIMSEYLPLSKTIANAIRESLVKKTHVSLSAFDDRYLAYLSYMYIQAYINGAEFIKIEKSNFYKNECIKLFHDAGIRIISTPKYYFVQNIKKGGIFKLVSKIMDNSLFDSGVIIEDKKGHNFYSFYLNYTEQATLDNNRYIISRKLSSIPQNVLTPLSNILQRIFFMSIGKIEWLEKKTKDILRNMLITNIKLSNFNFTREIEFTDVGCVVIDSVNNLGKIKKIIIGVKASYVYGPSTRFFQSCDLNQEHIILSEKDLLEYKHKNVLKIFRQFDFNCKLIKFSANAL